MTLKDYRQAFMQFSGAGEFEFQIKEECGALALYEGNTYRICTYDDLLADFKTYFNLDYIQIYTETPFALWEILFKNHHEITDDDLIIDIFNAWNIFWEGQQRMYSKRETYEASKAESRLEFNQLIEKLQAAPGSFIANAIAISDITLIPVIALALRSRFESEEKFYRECLDILIDILPQLFGIDGNFDEHKVLTQHSGLVTFYIYRPDYNFGIKRLFQ